MAIQLDQGEREILTAFESGRLKAATKKQDLIKYQAIATATFKKDKRINIRISSRDLDSIQRLALQEGIPYQTLVSSVLHKYVSGSLKSISS